jgi:hypothetical protein
MRHPIASVLALTCLASLAGTASANDSSAELATGGLVFVTNGDVEMRSEKLFISAEQIRVTYEFFNKSDKDVTTLVAFPLPEIRITSPDDMVAVPTEGTPDNIFGFKTTVDGVPVKAEVDQRVTVLGIDRTQYVRALGVPLDPNPETNDALTKLPPEKWPELVTLGLAEVVRYSDGDGPHEVLQARWGLATTYYWKQTFPAKKRIVIQHQYMPSVGRSVGTAFGMPDEEKESWYPDYMKKYCIDQSFLATIKSLSETYKNEPGLPYGEQRIDYILRTGANWSGPIGDFELTVDKGLPDALVTFCGTDVKQISPTQFQMRQKNFTPDGDLAVLILIKTKN